ncbi:Meiotically up-regulated protein [Wickerhamomyces ciferrii]|uniref:Meiotically up-regulated protein n=1 Tax=Wickerhamomyces ciferrii (strain ATCC 14091 / BCRC 22168 / CBS 111 / JCM 3599 / NBRC 0793 / NRRL Y-1031 F-60-10) TaxID=1206466 RepID=K0KF81_WICCF|nr:Meiotically up-regulated protein [Wickerhamomyces ciferrii]CCH40882.1 Meiotically up-regulated protein [Wickerhamomyces ciferrii]
MGFSWWFWLKQWTQLPLVLAYNYVFRNKTFNSAMNKLRWMAKSGEVSDFKALINDRDGGAVLDELKTKKGFHEVSNEQYSSRSRWVVKSKNLNKDSPILFFVHGGGFTLKPQKGQLMAVLKTYRALKNEDLSILVVDYHVTPETQFPTPIDETFTVYHKLTEQDGFKNIIIMGDSCGANLASLVLYQSYHNSLNQFLKLSIRPNAALLMSPWVELDAKKTGSFLEKEQFDYISFESVDSWSKLYSENDRSNPLVSPLYLENWDGVLPEKHFYHYGDGEVLTDQIVKFKNKLGVKDENVSIEPNGCHIPPFIQFPKLSQEEFEKTKWCKDTVAFLKTVV